MNNILAYYIIFWYNSLYFDIETYIFDLFKRILYTTICTFCWVNQFIIYTVIKVDIVPPTVTFCPQQITLTTPFGTFSTIATWAEPTATDDCPGVPMRVQSHISGDDFPVGVTQVTFIFTDAAGNDAFCQFTITGKYKELRLYTCNFF